MKRMNFVDRKTCPACSSGHVVEIYTIGYQDPIMVKYLDDFYSPQGGIERRYLKGARFTLAKCLECRLIFQKSVPGEFLMRKLYNEWISPQQAIEENKAKAFRRLRQYSAEIISAIEHFGANPQRLTFLDFGMGWGDWVLMAKAFGVNCFGCELSEERVDHARRNAISVLTWDEIPSVGFDFINAEQVFEHIPDPLGTLGYLARSLKPHGVIKINVPNGNRAYRILKKMDWSAPKGTADSLNFVAPLEHINCFTTYSLIHMANKCALKPARIESVIIHHASLREHVKCFLTTLYRECYPVLRRNTYLLLRRT